MNKKLAVIVSPNWKDYAHKYLADLLDSLRVQRFDGESKLFLIDNESSPESLNYLRSLAPEAEIVINEKNDGFAKGNNDAIKLALKQNFDYIFLINMDTVLDQNCFQKMVEAIQTEGVGAVQARLMLWPEKEKINSVGNASHFLGFGYSLGYQQKYDSQEQIDLEIAYPSGAGVIFSADVLKQVGLFDEEFWMYNEDQDLGWRIWLAGFKCILARDAIVYHKYEFSRSIKKYYWMDRNRILAILKNYHLLTLILIFPVFVLMEVGLLFFAILKGWLPEKLRVYEYFFRASTWRYLTKARKDSQTIRRVADRQIVTMFKGRILYQEIDNVLLRLANIFFEIYWKIVRLLIFW